MGFFREQMHLAFAQKERVDAAKKVTMDIVMALEVNKSMMKESNIIVREREKLSISLLPAKKGGKLFPFIRC